MDKDTFFAALTNEAATPDPAFIEALRKKVIAISTGAVPPSTGGGSIIGNPGIIAGGIVTTAIAGGVAFALLGNKPADPPSTPVAVQIVEDEPSEDSQQTDVLGEETNQNDQDENATGDENVATNTNDTTTTANTPSDPNQSGTSDNDDTATVDPPAELDESFSLSFWNVPTFKVDTPSISATAADLTLTGVEAIDFDWGLGSPDPDAIIDSDFFVARASATKYFEPGNYKINMTHDDGMRAYIDGVLIYDQWPADGTVQEAFFTVKNADNVNVVYEYYEQGLNAIFKAEISEHKKTATPGGEAVLIETTPSLQLTNE